MKSELFRNNLWLVIRRNLVPVRNFFRGANNSLCRRIAPEKFYTQRFFYMLEKQKTVNQVDSPHITIEVSSLCNINCLMCGTKSATRSRGFIDVDFFEKIIKEIIIPNKQRSITMNTIGETLLHPQLDKIFAVLEKYSISLVLVTNGLLLYKHRQIIKKFSRYISNIQISIEGATKETYEKLRRGGKYEDLIKSLAWLKSHNEQLDRQIPCEINSVLSKDNISELPLFIETFSKYVGWENLYFYLLNDKMADFGENDFFKTSRLLEGIKPELRSPCLLPFVKSHIHYDGSVGACCRDYHGELLVGNIGDSSFKEIWQGKRYTEIRHTLREKRHKDLPLCKTCYELPFEITIAVNAFIHYSLYLSGGEGDKALPENLLKFLNEINALYVSDKLNEVSFKASLKKYHKAYIIPKVDAG